MKSKSCFIIEYCCKGASSGRQIAIATNAVESMEIFFKSWDEDAENGIAIPKDEIVEFSIERWCDSTDLLK